MSKPHGITETDAQYQDRIEREIENAERETRFLALGEGFDDDCWTLLDDPDAYCAHGYTIDSYCPHCESESN